MPGLVTLGSAPYNPYNTAFGEFAMRGFEMAQKEMARTDDLAQRSFENVLKVSAMASQSLQANAEMRLKNKEQERLTEAMHIQERNQNRQMDIAESAQAIDQQKWSDLAPSRAAALEVSAAQVAATKASVAASEYQLGRSKRMDAELDPIAIAEAKRKAEVGAQEDSLDVSLKAMDVVHRSFTATQAKLDSELATLQKNESLAKAQYENIPEVREAAGLKGTVAELKDMGDMLHKMSTGARPFTEDPAQGAPKKDTGGFLLDEDNPTKSPILTPKQAAEVTYLQGNVLSAMAGAARLGELLRESAASYKDGKPQKDLSAKIAAEREALENARATLRDGLAAFSPLNKDFDQAHAGPWTAEQLRAARTGTDGSAPPPALGDILNGLHPGD